MEAITPEMIFLTPTISNKGVVSANLNKLRAMVKSQLIEITWKTPTNKSHLTINIHKWIDSVSVEKYLIIISKEDTSNLHQLLSPINKIWQGKTVVIILMHLTTLKSKAITMVLLINIQLNKVQAMAIVWIRETMLYSRTQIE